MFPLEGRAVKAALFYCERAAFTEGCPTTSDRSEVSISGTYDPGTGTLEGTFVSDWNGSM
ncbi:MAG: hypothetical protein JXA25_04110 [Anaerolineales bacterium]|nr:hypothetical protein [Anaerolineales bacterium]